MNRLRAVRRRERARLIDEQREHPGGPPRQLLGGTPRASSPATVAVGEGSAGDLAGRRVLVTGGAGFIGSRVVDGVISAGGQVLSVDLRGSRFPLPEPHAALACDVCLPELAEVMARFAPHVVVHLAAQVGVPAAVRRPDWDARVNIVGTINVARAAADAGVERLVFSSSCAIYGRPAELPVAEHAPLRPMSPYGLSKAAATEYLAYFAAERGLSVTSLVLGNVYGGHPRADGGVIDRFIEDALTGRPSVLHAGGASTRDFVHVEDVTDAVLRACARPGSGLVNIGSGMETSTAEVHRLVAHAVGNIRPAQSVAARPGDVPRMRLRVSRARQLLGWQPRISLEDGIAALVAARTAVTR